MNVAAIIAAVVAVIAAFGSAGAALLSYRSQNDARRSAEKVNSINHQIAALDRRIEGFRNDYRDYAHSLAITKFSDMGKVISSCEVLRANALATTHMSAALGTLTIAVTDFSKRRNPDEEPAFDGYLEDIREEYVKAMTRAEARREELTRQVSA
ncbi:hypothetical protein [Rudaeicoccus suwonensis]|uniref:Uncharacterized protein n=1 Tax=Rudaeicoccus suwonensis TaxID=657409 RepID=A0A561ECB4_9MICO|nr:hypothetical protein [Rudaeicoccus suwonensis]TWE13255.1 hypothetical protein BKA23_2084 [Rudaeicoccus suwonensis]